MLCVYKSNENHINSKSEFVSNVGTEKLTFKKVRGWTGSPVNDTQILYNIHIR